MSGPAQAVRNLSVEEFEIFDAPEGYRVELVRGEVQMTPGPGGRHGVIIVRLAVRLGAYAEQHSLGQVFASASFELVQLPRTVRIPDLTFVRADRLPATGVGPGFMRMAPDLAVEVVSPSETPARLQEKLDDYRMAGVPLTWVIDPVTRTVTIHAANAPIVRLTERDTLDGATVVPGFRVRIADLFIGVSEG